MPQEWRTLFSDLEHERRELMLRLNGLTPAQLRFQPAPTRWSLLQVVDHLVLVERAMTKDARERLLQPARTVTPREYIMTFVVLCVMKSSIRIKTPAGASNVTPRQNTSLNSVANEWSRTRDDLEHLLEELSPERQASAIFRHPVSGGMTPYRGLKFIRAHISHHGAQIGSLIQLSSQGGALAGVAEN